MPTIKGFQWDARKNALNLTKHGIDFDEALEVFYRPHALRRSDRNNEERWIAIGESEVRVITVAFAYRGEEIRIISARRARRHEERTYREETMGRATEGQD
ncbi:MAG: BrnT family toxin [Rhizobiales bacterium]|nr:BrnT family toxin [Hyphomicrobiales bacterium]